MLVTDDACNGPGDRVFFSVVSYYWRFGCNEIGRGGWGDTHSSSGLLDGGLVKGVRSCSPLCVSVSIVEGVLDVCIWHIIGVSY